MSDEGKKRPEVNDFDSADVPLPNEDDFALAALDFLSEALGGDTSPVDTGSVPNDFFDTQQLSSMAAMKWQSPASTGADTSAADTGSATNGRQTIDLDSGLMNLAESMTQSVPEANKAADITSDASLMDLVESLTGPVIDEPLGSTDATLLDLAEGATGPVPDVLDDSDAALLDLAEGATGPVPDVIDDSDAALMDLAQSALDISSDESEPLPSKTTQAIADPLAMLAEESSVDLPDLSEIAFDEETLLIELAESTVNDLAVGSAETHAEPINDAADEAALALDLLDEPVAANTSAQSVPFPNLESDILGVDEPTIINEIPLPDLDQVLFDAPLDESATADPPSVADTAFVDEGAALAALEAQFTEEADIDAELEALAALEASSDDLDVDAALAALAEAESNAFVDPTPQPALVKTLPVEPELDPVASIEDELAGPLDLLEEAAAMTVDAFGDDALDLLDADPIDLDAPIDIASLAADAMAEIDEQSASSGPDDLFMGAAESAIMAEDALSVLDGSDALALNPVGEAESAEEETTSDYLDLLVASIDAQLTTSQRQETLLDLSSDSAEEIDSSVEQLIVFSIGGSQYAIPIENVLEVGEPPTTTPIPFVPPWVRGVFNMRGDILSLVDLRSYFELEANANDSDEWMIVSQTTREDMTVGLLVDDIIGNRQMNARDAADLTSKLDGALAEYVTRLYRQNNELISVIDFNKLLNSAEMRQFELA